MHGKYILHKVQLIEIPYSLFKQPNELQDISGGTVHIHIEGVLRSTFPIGSVNKGDKLIFEQAEYVLIIVTVLLEYLTELDEH